MTMVAAWHRTMESLKRRGLVHVRFSDGKYFVRLTPAGLLKVVELEDS